MVNIKKQTVNKKTYYYLEHSYREHDKVLKKQKYLGKSIPENIEYLKKSFLSEIYNEMWLNKIDSIQKNFSKEQKVMLKSAKEKEIATFMIKFTYNTQRIEGSTLTFKETANLLERGITPKEKSIFDVKEAETHKELFYDILNYKKDLNFQTVLYWHKKLLEKTHSDIAGKIRNHQIAISGSKFMPPFQAELNILLKEFFDWYQKNKDKLHPVVLAGLVHLKFVTIHPFSDGNGRISRIMMNFVLNKYKYPLLNIAYNKRASYYNALERSQIKKQDGIFVQWFLKRYIKEHENYSK